MDHPNQHSHPPVFDEYPAGIRLKMLTLRQLILDTAEENDYVGSIEETLKWGEPAYLSRHGSTVRIGWKPSRPEQYALYFNCKTRLVETFREIYNGTFNFEGNRAILLGINEPLPVNELKHCILLAFNYHKIKQLPLLGV